MKIYVAICVLLFSFNCFANQNQQEKITDLPSTSESDYILSFDAKLNAEKEREQKEYEAKGQLLQQEEAKQQLLEEQKLQAEIKRLERERQLDDQKFQADMEKIAHENDLNDMIGGVIWAIFFIGIFIFIIVKALDPKVRGNQQSSNYKCDTNNPNQTNTNSRHSYNDDSSRWHDSPSGINPSSGLPLSSSSLDIAGNAFGSSIGSSSTSHRSGSYDPSRGY